MVDEPLSDGASRLECPPINLIYSHYHNAIRAELSRLSINTSKLESSCAGDLVEYLRELKTQFRFLEKIYKYHSSVEDEVSRPTCHVYHIHTT
jgi:zinc finger-like protein